VSLGQGAERGYRLVKHHLFVKRKRMPPIKAMSLEAFGPIFKAVKLQLVNQDN